MGHTSSAGVYCTTPVQLGCTAPPARHLGSLQGCQEVWLVNKEQITTATAYTTTSTYLFLGTFKRNNKCCDAAARGFCAARSIGRAGTNACQQSELQNLARAFGSMPRTMTNGCTHVAVCTHALQRSPTETDAPTQLSTPAHICTQHFSSCWSCLPARVSSIQNWACIVEMIQHKQEVLVPSC